MNKVYNVTILWGTDGFWKWLTEYILQEFCDSVSITITGRNKEKWNTVSQDIGVMFSDNNISAVQNADIVIYSVPISLTEKTINETLPYIPAGSVVADVTSIKKFPSKAMNVRDDITVIPTHPMFGPYISSIAGQVFVLTPEESVKMTPEYIFLKWFLEEKKAKIKQETPESHDKMMAVVQGLTHLNMFVVGETMKRLNFSIENSMDFISPIYKLMVSSVGRYLWQNPGLYADIQMYNDEVLSVHEAFLETTHNFHDSVRSWDSGKFCHDVLAAKDFVWAHTCQEWQEYTDKIIYMLGRQLDLLKENIWKQISLRNIYTSEQVTGKLLDFNENEICLEGKKNYNLNSWEILS